MRSEPIIAKVEPTPKPKRPTLYGFIQWKIRETDVERWEATAGMFPPGENDYRKSDPRFDYFEIPADSERMTDKRLRQLANEFVENGANMTVGVWAEKFYLFGKSLLKLEDGA